MMRYTFAGAAAIVLTVTVLFTAMLAAPASAALITVAPFGEQDGESIYALSVTGEISPGDDARVRQALAAVLATDPGGVFLLLSTPGGDTVAALGIARIVRANGVGVLVQGDCTSGCGIAALGAQRGHLFVVEGGRIGLHQCWAGEDYAPVPNVPCTNMVARALRGYGVPDAILDRMLTTPPQGMSYLSDIELAEIGARLKR